MSKALFDDHLTEIFTALTDVYNIKASKAPRVIFSPWTGIGLHLIFDDDTPGLTDIVRTRAAALLQREMLQYYIFFDLDVDIPTPMAGAENVDSRTVTVDKSGMSEDQPLNDTITSITSPTEKRKEINTATDTNTRTTVDDNIKWSEYLKDLETFGTHIRRILSPLIEEFSEMY